MNQRVHFPFFSFIFFKASFVDYYFSNLIWAYSLENAYLLNWTNAVSELFVQQR
jgi:hypothetical protein